MDGFDENFPVAYNDVDLCFKIYEAGYYNVIRNDVRAYHYESLSRGLDLIDESKTLRLSAERQNLYQKHPNFKGKDPFLNDYLHNHGVILDLKNNYNEISLNNVDNYLNDAIGCIDNIEINDKVIITGWACLLDKNNNNEFKRYLILEDISKNRYKVTLNNIERKDIVEHFNNKKDLLNSGFECVLDNNILRTDLMEYKIGVLIVDTKGSSHIFWDKNRTTITKLKKDIVEYSEPVILNDNNLKKTTKEVIWNIDKLENNEEKTLIYGWMFCDKNNNYKYKKELILKCEDGELLIFKAIERNRVDISIEFPDIHFLYNTGFICNILNKHLKQGKKYEIILCLTNRFDKNDVNYVITNKEITI